MFANYYQVTKKPVVIILDAETKSKLKEWEGFVEPDTLLDHVTSFVEEHEDANTQKKQRVEARMRGASAAGAAGGGAALSTTLSAPLAAMSASDSGGASGGGGGAAMTEEQELEAAIRASMAGGGDAAAAAGLPGGGGWSLCSPNRSAIVSMTLSFSASFSVACKSRCDADSAKKFVVDVRDPNLTTRSHSRPISSIISWRL